MRADNQRVHLVRVFMAALMAELVPLLILLAAVSVYGFIIAPNQSAEYYQAFSDQIGKFVGPMVAGLVTLGFGFWAARKPPYNHVLHGFLTGLLVAVLDIVILFSTSAEFNTINAVMLVVKILAGTLGGYLAKRRYQNLPVDARESHRII